MKKLVLLLFLISFSPKNGLFSGFEEYAISTGGSYFSPLFRSLTSRFSEKIREGVAHIRTGLIKESTNLAFVELEKEIKKADPVIAILQNVVRKKGFAASMLGIGLSSSMFLYELYLQYKRRQQLITFIADLENKITQVEVQIEIQKEKMKSLESYLESGAEPYSETSELHTAQKTLGEMQTNKQKLEKMLQKKREELARIPVRLVRKFIGSLIGITGFAAIGITTVGAGAAAQWLEWLKTLRIGERMGEKQ